MIERQPTPLEARLIGVASFGAAICESLAVNNMVTMAVAMEKDYSKLGGGAPPLSMVNDVHLMWAEVAGFATAEA